MKGNWKNGELYGEATQRLGDSTKFPGDIYVGNFNHGYDGYGTYYGKVGDFVHKGYWKNGKPDGYGESRFGSHSTNPNWSYKGEWKAGKRTGYGTMFMGTVGARAGITYIGYWLNDNMHGAGKYIWPDGSVYDGHFADDYFDGKATFTFSDGSRYIGEWYHGNSPGFLKVLDWDSKHVRNKDSILTKFFLGK